MASDGTSQPDETIVVLGKHLSNQGLGFYCSEPLPYRRAIASFECVDGTNVRMLIELTWCRFCRHGWYENGGRFLQSVGSPIELGSLSRCAG